MNSSKPRQQRESQQVQRQEINAQFLINSLKQWWMVAAPLGILLAAGAAAGVYALHKPEYESSALIEIQSFTPYLVFKNADQTTRFVANQVQIIRSPVLLSDVAIREDMRKFVAGRDDPIAYLSDRINVTSFGQSDLFSVSFRAEDPDEAYEVNKALMNEYFKMRDDEDSRRVNEIVTRLAEEQSERRIEVEAMQKRIRELSEQRSQDDPFAPDANAPSTGRLPLANLMGRLTEAEVNISVLNARIDTLEGHVNGGDIRISEITLDRAVNGDPEVIYVRNQLDAKRLMLRDYEKVAKGNNSRVEDLKKRIGDEELRLAKLRKERREQMAESHQVAEVQKRRDELQSLYAQRDGKQIEMDVLQKKFDAQMQLIRQSNSGNVELEFQRSKLARAEGVVDRLADRIILLSTEREAPSRVKLLREANKPTQPIEKYPVKMMGLTAGGSFVIPFLLCLLWELRVQRIRNVAQLEEQHQMVVVGEVATLPARRGMRRAARGLEHAVWLFEESIDSLRTALVLSDPLKDMCVLAVTSAVSQEGKTSVATQLAVSIGRATGEKTLLIDGDMRAPDIHNVFEVPREPGFAKVLDGKVSLDEAVTPWSEHLHVLPAGKLHVNPHRLVMGGRLEKVLAEARGKYRYVILDTPPVLAASESLVMTKAADTSLVCAMRDYSRMDQVRQVYERLVQANAAPFGIVLNGVSTRSYAYRYGRYDYARAGQVIESSADTVEPNA